jgi:hypothetical protein
MGLRCVVDVCARACVVAVEDEKGRQIDLLGRGCAGKEQRAAKKKNPKKMKRNPPAAPPFFRI